MRAAPKLMHVGGLILAACLMLPSRADAAKNVGEIAPDFSRADFAGHSIRLADYRGKLILLNFWASWCGPCLAEMPRFAGWQHDYGGQGLQIIGVSMDDDPAPARRLLAAHPLPYPVVMGDARLGEQYGGVLGLPLTYLIDPSGRIVGRYQGAEGLAKMEAQIKTSLAATHR